MKIFTDGQILTAEDINAYLVNKNETLNTKIVEYQENLQTLRANLAIVEGDLNTPIISTQGFVGNDLQHKTMLQFADCEATVAISMTNLTVDERRYLSYKKLDTDVKSLAYCAVSLMNRGNFHAGIVVDPIPSSFTGIKRIVQSNVSSSVLLFVFKQSADSPITLILSIDAVGQQYAMSDGSTNFVAFLAGEKA